MPNAAFVKLPPGMLGGSQGNVIVKIRLKHRYKASSSVRSLGPVIAVNIYLAGVLLQVANIPRPILITVPLYHLEGDLQETSKG